MTTAESTPRPGRPPKVDAQGRPTRERLLAAAAEACVQCGFEGATLTDIAHRADVSPPAIYNHFNGKSDLLVEACRWALASMRGSDPRPIDPVAVVQTYLSPGFADLRVLQLELHLASLRHPDVRDLLAKWHGDRAQDWTGDGGASLAAVKAWYLLLLGLAQVDALSSIDVTPADLEAHVRRQLAALFDEEGC